ncbi:MAG: FecR domain-containing protein [Fidelibacterota bacterium]
MSIQTTSIFAVILSLSVQSAKADDAIATVTKTRPSTEVKRMGETAFSVLSPGTPAFSGDVIRTGESGFCMVIYLDDKSILKIRESSEFQFLETENTRTLDVQFGKILTDIKKERKKQFRIETPVSVASVKATQFWVVSNQQGFDRFYGLEGQVEILNKISGQATILGPGQMTLSTATGQLVTAPASPEEIPEDPEKEVEEEIREEPEIEPEVEEAPTPEPEEVEEVPGEEPVPEEEFFEEAPETGEEVEAEGEEEAPTEEPEAEGPKPFNMGLGIGSATIDGTIYNQFALRPELRFGKLGIGLDLVLYIDNQGNIRPDEWDEASDVIDKFLYVRWAERSDPFWIKVGALEDVTLGYGGILSGYSNMMEFPSVRRVGVNTGFNVVGLGTEIFLANVKDFSRGGTLLGLRGTYTLSEKIPLTLGASFVMDMNQFSGLEDRDKDDIPNVFDAFPQEEFELPTIYPPGAFEHEPGDVLPGEDYAVDSDNDGIPDDLDYDRDGDGLTDNFPTDTTREFPLSYELDSDPFSLKENKGTATGVTIDIGYPVLRTKMIGAVVFTEYNRLSFPKVDSPQFQRQERLGTGITIPGIRAQLFGFLNLSFEYRIKQDYFVPQFFDRAYDLNRAVARYPTDDQEGVEVFTKDMLIFEDSLSVLDTKGYFGSSSFSLLNLVSFSASYTNMVADAADTTIEFNSFFASLNLNTENIPKLSQASAYYQRNNDPDPFDFKNPSVNTVLGYRLGYEISKGVSLVWDFRQFYRDTGEGLEPVKQTTIETLFSF